MKLLFVARVFSVTLSDAKHLFFGFM